MTNKLRTKEKGFTIVEVLIVLAIAGVIMLVVFLAVPALQRNSRNTQRRSDASHLAGLINEYTANHAGVLPTGFGTAAGQVDVANEKFAIMTSRTITAAGGFPGDTVTLQVDNGYTCDATTNALSASSAKQFAIAYKVETGGADANACFSG